MASHKPIAFLFNFPPTFVVSVPPGFFRCPTAFISTWAKDQQPSSVSGISCFMLVQRRKSFDSFDKITSNRAYEWYDLYSCQIQLVCTTSSLYFFTTYNSLALTKCSDLQLCFFSHESLKPSHIFIREKYWTLARNNTWFCLPIIYCNFYFISWLKCSQRKTKQGLNSGSGLLLEEEAKFGGITDKLTYAQAQKPNRLSDSIYVCSLDICDV